MALPATIKPKVNLTEFLEPDLPELSREIIIKTINPAVTAGYPKLCKKVPYVLRHLHENVVNSDQAFLFTPLVLAAFDAHRALFWNHVTCRKTLQLNKTHGKVMNTKAKLWKGDVERVLHADQTTRQSHRRAIDLMTIDAEAIDHGGGAAIAAHLLRITAQNLAWRYHDVCAVSYVLTQNSSVKNQTKGLAEKIAKVVLKELPFNQDTISPGLNIRTGTAEELSVQLAEWLK